MFAVLLVALLCALPMRGATLTLQQALIRANHAHGLDALPDDALRTLEAPPRFEWPVVRAEGSLSNARSLDIFNEQIVHSQSYLALVSVDYPLLDGGSRALRQEASRLAARSFRERTRELADAVHDETVDAVARLFVAQERSRILRAGYERAIAMKTRANEMLVSHEISNTTAAQWQDEALAAEAQLIDLDIERLDAEARLRQLMGDTSSEPIDVAVILSREDGEGPQPSPQSAQESSFAVSAAQDDVNLRLARAARKPQLLLSAFGGVAGVPDTFSLYGVRMTVSFPMFDAAARRRVAEAQLELAAAQMQRVERPKVNVEGLQRRIDILARAVDIAKERAASVTRLTTAGLRSESALAAANVDVARRESELLAARVELWKAMQHVR